MIKEMCLFDIIVLLRPVTQMVQLLITIAQDLVTKNQRMDVDMCIMCIIEVHYNYVQV